MYFLSLALLAVFVTYGNFQQLFPKNGVNYGPYELNVTHSELCSGVKLQRTQTVVYLEQKAPGNYISFMNITFLNSLQLTFVKVFVYRGTDLSTYAWKYIIKNPCQHPVTALILNENFGNNIDSHCVIKKGYYSIRMPVSDTASVFLGKQFFYGAFSFKTMLTYSKSSVSVISCNVLKCVFIKK